MNQHTSVGWFVVWTVAGLMTGSVIINALGCGPEEEKSSTINNSDWDCSADPSDFHHAFVQCTTAMGLATQDPYTAGQCEDYAHRNFCVSRKAKENAQLKQAQAETKKVRAELAKTKKLAEKYHRHRNIFCATLEGMCIMYGIETKTDKDCEYVCVIDDEDVSREVDKEIALEKKAEKESP